MGTIAILPISFLTASIWLYYLTSIAPVGNDNHEQVIKFPSNIGELKTLASIFEVYKKENFIYVILLFSSAYLYKQTFAIPGSVFMNVLAGALYGRFFGFLLVCFLTGFGASFCYLLSRYCGKFYIEKYFSSKLEFFQSKVKENESHLLYFLLSLRLFPVTPNWFINLASPILNIPIHLFFISVFVGLMPYNMICIHTGVLLSSVQSLDDILTLKTFFGMLVLSLLAMLPAILKKFSR